MDPDLSPIFAPCTDATLDAAARRLCEGRLVAFPTETVYGLGADATRPAAVARIFAAKGRPKDHPLIVHLAEAGAMSRWASHVPAYAQALARACWPGPMTLVLRRSALAGDWVTGAQDSVGLRVPGHPQALRLLAAFARLGGEGVAAPSANRFGHVSPTTAAAVQEELGAYLSAPDTILDGGDCPVGIESTIIDCTGGRPRVLRPGALTRETIERVGGVALEHDYSAAPRVSGSLVRHYAPLAQVVLDATPQPGDGLIALAEVPTPSGVLRLCEPSDPEAFAHDLYAALRRADALGLRRVVVVQPGGDGLAIALRDRLARAAEGREGEGGT